MKAPEIKIDKLNLSNFGEDDLIVISINFPSNMTSNIKNKIMKGLDGTTLCAELKKRRIPYVIFPFSASVGELEITKIENWKFIDKPKTDNYDDAMKVVE